MGLAEVQEECVDFNRPSLSFGFADAEVLESQVVGREDEGGRGERVMCGKWSVRGVVSSQLAGVNEKLII